MKKVFCVLFLTSILFSSCGSTKRGSISTGSKGTKTTKQITKSDNKKINNIISYAKGFEGTRYKFGGTTKRGMDCSGLVYTSFKKENIELPRISRDMATKGQTVSLKKVAIGDLLFFKTGKNKRRINHVGLVISTGDQVRFIHASVSRGVTVSSLDERYWNTCFVGARRIL